MEMLQIRLLSAFSQHSAGDGRPRQAGAARPRALNRSQGSRIRTGMKLSLIAACAAAALLAACSPGAPKGVDKDQLDEAVSRAIGDPASCLLIAEVPGGRV